MRGLGIILSLLLFFLPTTQQFNPVRSSGISLRGGAINSRKTTTKTATKTATKQQLPTSPTLSSQILSGLTVSLASLPTSLTYSTIAHVDPLVSLWSTAITAFVSSLSGIRPGVVMGSAGVVAVPVGLLVTKYGIGVLSPLILSSVAFSALFGLLCKIFLPGNTQFIEDLVSPTVLKGFMNALGFLFLTSQMTVLCSASGSLLPSDELTATIAIIAAVMAGCKGLPVVFGKDMLIPPPIVMIVVATLATKLADDALPPIATLSSIAPPSTFMGGIDSLPKLLSPSTLFTDPVNSLFSGDFSQFLKAVGPGAASIAFITQLETLLAKKIVDEANVDVDGGATPGDNTALSATFANFVSVLFGGFGGSGLIPQSILNLSTGGTTRLSSLSFAVFFAAGIVLFAPTLAEIPIPALSGVILLVAFSTMQISATWDIFKTAVSKSGHKSDVVNLATIFVATYLGVELDFASGIVAGSIVEKLGHALFK